MPFGSRREKCGLLSSCELENVDIATLPVRKVWAHWYIEERRRGSVEPYVLGTIVTSLYLIMLVWCLMAGGGR